MRRTTPNININTTQKLRDRLGFKEFVLQVNKETFVYQFRPTSISVADNIYFTLNLNPVNFSITSILTKLFTIPSGLVVVLSKRYE